MENIMKEHSEVLERERENLYSLVALFGLQHPIVIKQSELLDKMINIHNEMQLLRFSTNVQDDEIKKCNAPYNLIC